MSRTRSTDRLLLDLLNEFVGAQTHINRLVHEGNKIFVDKRGLLPSTEYLRQEIVGGQLALARAAGRIQEFEVRSRRRKR